MIVIIKFNFGMVETQLLGRVDKTISPCPAVKLRKGKFGLNVGEVL